MTERDRLPLPVAGHARPRAAVLAATALALLAALPPTAAATPYRLDPTHTAVHWAVVHMGTSTSRGRFDRIEGEATFEPGRRLDVAITVDTASVSTGIPAFDRVLRGGSLLAVEAHPRARFVSDRVDWGADGISPAAVHGTLTLRGQARPLVLRAERWRCGNNPLFGREVCGGDFTATVSRRAFGLDFASGMADDAVTLQVQVEGVRTEPGDDRPGSPR